MFESICGRDGQLDFQEFLCLAMDEQDLLKRGGVDKLIQMFDKEGNKKIPKEWLEGDEDQFHSAKKLGRKRSINLEEVRQNYNLRSSLINMKMTHMSEPDESSESCNSEESGDGGNIIRKKSLGRFV